MKKRTLNQTWTLCLRMWRSVAGKWITGADVCILKKEWVKENEVSAGPGNCFFCNYAETCLDCPGGLVDASFHCWNEKYDYETNPPAFYKELLRLNRIRKVKK